MYPRPRSGVLTGPSPIFANLANWLPGAVCVSASKRSQFAFTGKPTAIYRASEGESGAGSGSNLDRDRVIATRARLMRKWHAEA